MTHVRSVRSNGDAISRCSTNMQDFLLLIICIINLQMANVPAQSDSEVSQSPSACSNSGEMWDVQEILAERTSVTGEGELLVVWKTSWIPISNMHSDGPIMRKFRDAAKLKFYSTSNSMRLILPVEPGTVLAHDCATNVAAGDAAPEAAYNSEAAQKRRYTGQRSEIN